MYRNLLALPSTPSGTRSLPSQELANHRWKSAGVTVGAEDARESTAPRSRIAAQRGRETAEWTVGMGNPFGESRTRHPRIHLSPIVPGLPMPLPPSRRGTRREEETSVTSDSA